MDTRQLERLLARKLRDPGRQPFALPELALTMLLLLPVHAKVQYELAHHVRRKLADTTDRCEWMYGLTALTLSMPELVSGDLVARGTTLLVRAEVEPGGPYTAEDGSISPLFNVLVALFLQSQHVSLPKLNTFLKAVVHAAKETKLVDSPELLYLLALLPEGKAPAFKKCLVTTAADTSRRGLYALTGLAEIGAAAAVRVHLPRAGTERLSTMGLVELAGWLRVYSRLSSVTPTLSKKDNRGAAKRAVYDLVDLTDMDGALHRDAKRHLEVVRRADITGEIALLPRIFLDSLKISGDASAWYEVCKQLGVANIYCWMAYTIYDDFLDDEGRASYLPLANSAMRRSLRVYQDAHHGSELLDEAMRAYDTMDHANHWETLHCRAIVTDGTVQFLQLPRYGAGTVISRRAYGHVAGVVGIARVVGLSAQQLRSLESGLHHFLVARQLNDDIHDWLKDFKRGQLSPVVVKLLRRIGVRGGTHVVADLVPKLQDVFWRYGHEFFCAQISHHITQARNCFAQMEVLDMQSDFIALVTSVDRSAQQGQAVQNNQKQFLKAYRYLTKD